MRSAFAGADGFGMEMSDQTFLRYLRARSYNFDKASTMLDSTLKWRKEFGLGSDFVERWRDIVSIENATGKTYVRGYDKSGHVLVYMRPANENTNQHDGNIKHLIYTMERAVACMKPEGNGKLCLVIDYNHYSLSNAPPMKTSREVLSILQDHYPERLFRAYCIRPPYIFYGFYSIISPFIDPVTKDKIRMLTNADMNNLKNKFYDEVDRSTLEVACGGLDDRPFISNTYLNGSFHEDFLTIINRTCPAATPSESESK
eukprot:gene7002-7559_t